MGFSDCELEHGTHVTACVIRVQKSQLLKMHNLPLKLMLLLCNTTV